jgi:hypothetical protein
MQIGELGPHLGDRTLSLFSEKSGKGRMKTAKQALRHAIENQRGYVDQWRGSSEALLFEAVRAIDYIFCAELFGDEPTNDGEKQYISFQTWGTNKTLARVMPKELEHGAFHFFQSKPSTQEPTDELLFHSGLLERAELLEEWLIDGLLSARVEEIPPDGTSGTRNLIVMKTDNASSFREIVSHEHRRWRSDFIIESDKDYEADLRLRLDELLPELNSHVDVRDGWRIVYTSTAEIDAYFLDCARWYLRRIWGADILGLDEKIGGQSFNEYLAVLTALSSRCQKHVFLVNLLKHRHPKLDLRNLITTFVPYDEFLAGLAAFLGADRLQVQQLLGSLTLEPANSAVHLSPRETTWAPVIRGSANHCLLPIYGLDINPYLFLMRDLASKYPGDWSRLANTREARWRAELDEFFKPPRWIAAPKGLDLRDGKVTVTDIDYAVYDAETNELGIFQLKWQQPVGMDARYQARKSAGKNLVTESNRWIASVFSWLEKYGAPELGRRLGFPIRPDLRVQCFVVARYNAHFSGFSDIDMRAAWIDWNHFVRGRYEKPAASMSQLASIFRKQIEDIASEFKGESYIVPLGDTAIILNPTLEPK